MRIAVLGATGMLGHAVCRQVSGTHEVHAVCRTLQGIPTVLHDCFGNCTLHQGFDALDEESLRTRLASIQPDVVINGVGAVKQVPAGNDPITAIRINALLPHLLARECDRIDAKLIQISTDCVYSGRRGNYREEDPPDPVDLYGQTKQLGEISAEPHLTLRTSILGPQLRGQGGLFEWFRSNRGSEVQGFGKAIYSGLTTQALAEILRTVITHHSSLTGLYHVSSNPISKFALLNLINTRFGYDITIRRDDTVVCDRSLDSGRFRAATGILVPTQASMLDALLV